MATDHVFEEQWCTCGGDRSLLPDEALLHSLMDNFYVIDYDGQQVTYRHTDADTGRSATITCSALDFISRVVQEVVAAGATGTEVE